MKWDKKQRHQIIERFLFCAFLSLAIFPTTPTSAQISSDPPDSIPLGRLIYKSYDEVEPYIDLLPAPCDPQDPDAHCDADSTSYYKPAVSPALPTRSEQTTVSDPYTWPASPTVKVWSHWPSGAITPCSGMLVDAITILTAGQCVFSHQSDCCNGGDAGCWVEDLEVIPAYADGLDLLGKSGYETILTWTDFTDSQNLDYDLAAVRLRYPLGAYIGWLGIGFDSDNTHFTDQPFTNAAYPLSPPYHGEMMTTWEGNFDDASASPEVLFYDGDIDAGQTGAAYYDSAYRVYGILSHQDPFSGTAVTRLTYEKFSAIRLFMEEGKPKGSGDLSVFNVHATPHWNLPGHKLTGIDFYVHNYSDTDLEETGYTFDIYLSEDNKIETSDTLLGTATYIGAIPANTGFRYVVPESALPTVPAEIQGSHISEGTFYIGIRSALADANPKNDQSDHYQPQLIRINDSADQYYYLPFWSH